MSVNSRYYPVSVPLRAVTLVVHGLNMRSEGMLSLVEWLGEQGSAAVLVSLTGHHGEAAGMWDVTSAAWERDMLEGYELARTRASGEKVPLFFLGYSLGALLGQAMVLGSGGRLLFDRQILLAPASSMRPRAYLLKGLIRLWGGLPLPSFAPARFRATRWLPVRIYEIMFDMETLVRQAGEANWQTPSLIVMDPKDELISYARLLRAIPASGKGQVDLLRLDSDMHGRYGGYHHLIVDEGTMGHANWQRFTAATGRFLFG